MAKQTLPVIAGVKAFIKKDNKFLIVKAHINDDLYFWDLPGGKVDFGESPFDALRREVKEEVFLDVEIKEPLGIWWFFKEIDGGQVVCSTFLCIPTSTNIDITKNPGVDDIREFRWVTKQEFLTGDYKVSDESLMRLIAEMKL
ncbi:MAG TPA: NUDIX hydrolase [Candidatus Bipolaricaulota bacterium]|nr:NUDIX hydrolase [Candidatus Bipolaricaulota bacterium]